jgi:opacity protein-like surface antigen
MTKNNILLAAAVAACLSLASAPARAEGDDAAGPRPGVSFGGRASYYRPKDADHGTLNGGAQVRWHITSVLALEGSADYRQNNFAGTTVDVFPVQASLLVYLLPGYRISPFILGGGGWYYTHTQGGGSAHQNRFGPHAGGGLEIFLARHWSIDGTYRYMWNEDIHSQDLSHPVGRNFSDQGYALTTGLNFLF